MKIIEKGLDKLVNLWFDKTKISVLFLFLVGFILRIVAALNIGVSADDANHALRPINIFSSGKLAIWDQSTSLWYYIQGIFYKIFGLNQIGSRFASILFGSFLIILMFLFVKKVFKSEKIALITSALITFSPLLIKNTLPEMDVAVGFFIILSAYYLFSYLDSKNKKDILFMSLAMGIGAMIKLYALILSGSFILFLFIYLLKDKANKKEILKVSFISFTILLVLVIPTLTHNYLLYKDKGFMDFIFSNTLKVGLETAEKHYSWAAGWMTGSDYGGFFLGNQRNFEPTLLPGSLVLLKLLFWGDPLIILLGFIGLFFCYNQNRKYFWFFLLSFFPCFTYLGSYIPMAKHFVWVLLLLAPISANFLKEVKIKGVSTKRIIIFIIIFNLIFLSFPITGANVHFYGKSSFNQLVEYKEKINPDSIIVVDSRIYRGNIHWAFSGTNYVEALEFFEIMNYLESINQSIMRNVDVFYVECVSDDCGWGTIKDQPDFNATMEEITYVFANSSYYNKEFYQPDRKNIYLPLMKKSSADYKIYKLNINVPLGLEVLAKKTHIWFQYPIGYDRSITQIFDDYEILSMPDKLLQDTSWIILYMELLIAYLFLLQVLILFFKGELNDKN